MVTYLFNDDFNGPAGTPPDPHNWTYDTGRWPYNNEEEVYTDSTANCFQDGQSNLVIRANRAPATRRRHATYTSARIHTKGKFELSSGWFEARILLNRQQGTWPAFWMLGDRDTGWPWCGEIDIMESYGNLSWPPDSTVHTASTPPGSRDYSDSNRNHAIPGGIDSAYHSYKMHHDSTPETSQTGQSGSPAGAGFLSTSCLTSRSAGMAGTVRRRQVFLSQSVCTLTGYAPGGCNEHGIRHGEAAPG
jgi:beta-glucanase (GH16 family)